MPVLRKFLIVIVALLFAWSVASVWYDAPIAWASWLAGLLVVSAAVGLWRGGLRVGLGIAAGVFVVVLSWWLTLEPRNDRHWLPDQARLARAEIEGDNLTIYNVRNFNYRTETDFDERWETRTFDLRQLNALDLYLVYWGSPHIAHTMMSWAFADGQHLTVSIETRKELGESYSAVRGFFRNYELYYVVGDERDLVKLRSKVRGEDVYLYRLQTKPEHPRLLLMEYIRNINELNTKAQWYNAATTNCTTTIQTHIGHIAPDNPWSWKILANGHLDSLAHARGTIANSLPFEELRRRSYINPIANKTSSEENFSAVVRAGLPTM